MKVHIDKKQDNARQSTANEISLSSDLHSCQFGDNRPQAVFQRKLRALANNGPQNIKIAQFRVMADNHAPCHLPSQKAPIQRKVGFEFETLLKMKTVDTDKEIPYSFSVFQSNGRTWEVKSDNSKVEFVTTETPTNSSGREQLLTNMSEVVSWAGSLIDLSRGGTKADKRINTIGTSVGHASKYENEDIYLVDNAISRKDIVAAPQASGGVTLDKIVDLFEKLITTKLPHLKNSATFKDPYKEPARSEITGDRETDEFNARINKDVYDVITAPIGEIRDKGYDTTDIGYSVASGSLMMMDYIASARERVQEMINDVAALKGNDLVEFEATYKFPTSSFEKETGNLRGLLALMISYMYAGDKMHNPAPYTKAIAPVMSRTNFYQLYRLLSDKEKRFFTIEDILSVAQLDDGPIYKSGFCYNTKEKRYTVKGPTRSQWIRSIVEGTPDPTEKVPEDEKKVLPHDVMSVGSKTMVGQSSSSMGAMNQPDYNFRSEKNDLAVLELRSMPKNQHVDDWTKTALEVFNMFVELNTTDEEREAENRKNLKLMNDSSKARNMEHGYQF